MRETAEREGIALAQTIAIGDGANDLPMLTSAGLGVAFHAKRVVKESAQHAISNFGLDAVLYLIGFSDQRYRSGVYQRTVLSREEYDVVIFQKLAEGEISSSKALRLVFRTKIVIHLTCWALADSAPEYSWLLPATELREYLHSRPWGQRSVYPSTEVSRIDVIIFSIDLLHHSVSTFSIKVPSSLTTSTGDMS